MRLVMRAAYKQADESEAADMLGFLWISRGDGKNLAIRQRGCLRTPTLMAVHRLHPGGYHSLNCNKCAIVAGNRNFHTSINLLSSRFGLQGDLIHIDQMLTQGFQ